jgi:pentatricopeptide repeat protein
MMSTELTALDENFRRTNDFDAAFRLIVALRRSGRVEEAEAVLVRMAERDLPPECVGQLGVCAYELGLNDLSIGLFERSIPQLSTDNNRFVCNLDLAAALFASGRHHRAHPIYRMLRSSPWLSLNVSMITGREAWWAPLEDRLLCDQPVTGSRVMVEHEGGYGDLFQMIRYVDALKAEGAAQVIVVAPQAVHPIIATGTGASVSDRLAPEGEWDYFCPLFSLYARYQASPFNPIWVEPYLDVDTALAAAFDLPSAPGLRSWRPNVGIVWRSAQPARHEPFRSMALADFAPLISSDEVNWVSLQVDATEDERRLLEHLGARHIGDRLRSFSDTAQVIKQLDLLISIDSAPVHLAGALGRPVWALLCKAPDYRWYDDRRFTPWYPSARLFRQERLGDWSEVLVELASELRTL